MKKTLSFILLILLIFTLVGCNNQSNGSYVAKVNGQIITEEEFKVRVQQVAASSGFDLENEQMAAYKEMFELQVLDGMINEILMLSEAKSRNLEVKKEFEEQMKAAKSQFSSDKDFTAYLKNYFKMTEKEYAKALEESLLVQALIEEITKDINSPDRDIEQYYNDNKEYFFQEEQIKARHILVKTKEEAEEIIRLITEENQDMGDLAVLKSIEGEAKTSKGDLGYFSRGEMVKPFEDAAFALEVGEMTKEPVETTFGWHVIRVEDKKAAYQQTFEEVKDLLEEYFINQAKDNAFMEFLSGLKEKAEIENKLLEKIEAEKEKKAQEAEEQEKAEGEASQEDNNVEENTEENNGEKAE